MSNYLIICSDYLSSEDANGICVHNIVEELKKNGEVYIISEADKNGVVIETANEHVYGVKRTFFSQYLRKHKDDKEILSKLIRCIRGIFAAIFYPNVSPIRTLKVYKIALKLIENNIGTIICSYRPFESLASGMWLKKKYQDKKIIGYHLDLLTVSNDSNKLIRCYKKKRAHAFLKRELKVFDRLVVPKSAKSILGEQHNVSYVDFPLLVFNNDGKTCDFMYDADVYNFTYIGSIDGKNRDISFLLDLLRKIRPLLDKDVKVNIWGNLSSDQRVIIEDCEFAQWNGTIEHVYTFDLLKKADILVNLSNCITTDMVPSKIFQLFATGKPILNVVSSGNDASLPYFLINPIAFCVNSGKDVQPSEIKRLSEFIVSSVGLSNNEDEIKKQYIDSCPSFVASSFIDSI